MTEKLGWRQRERSSPFMLRLIIALGVALPRGIVRLLLYPIVAYFFVTGGDAKRASNLFLKRVLGREATPTDRWRHFLTFAACTLDRVLLLGGNHRRIHVDAEWSAGVMPIVTNGKGCLLIVAHFGSTDILRYTPPPKETSEAANRPLRVSAPAAPVTHIKTAVLMDRQAGQMLTELLERLNPELAIKVIDASERGPQLALRLKESLEAGCMVGVMADRVGEGEGFVEVEFLGGRAKFAESPWILAAALKAPVILGFGIHRDSKYECHFELFSERLAPKREERARYIQESAQRYANRLEHYVRLAPYNWFNFYDYWQSDAAKK